MGALSGVRILDFGRQLAGPQTTLLLALMGAEVIKVESRNALDIFRAEPTVLRDWRGTYGTFNSVNLNKKGICLDLNQPKAIEIVKKLAQVSDVVVENFRPGVMDRLGLGYPALATVKPDIIMLSSSGHGATGPERNYSAWAAVLGPLSGLSEVTGYPDDSPGNIRSAADMAVGVTCAYAVLASLIFRQRTGEGQQIDLSAREALACFGGEMLMDYTMNGRIQSRQANRDDVMAPHNCYRCLGDDRWISVAVADDKEWKALCRATGHLEWLKDNRFSTALDRWHNQEELDPLIEEWSSKHTNYEAMDILQKAGVAAVPSFSNRELCQDPHCLARDQFGEVDHPELGKQAVLGAPWRLSATPAGITGPAPTLGQYNRSVLGGLLHISDQEIDALEKEKVLF